MRSRGVTMIELIVGLLLAMLIGSALIKFFEVSFFTHDVVTASNFATMRGRTPIDVLADHLRNAQAYPPQDPAQSCVTDCQPTEITYYSDGFGNTVRYYLSGSELKRDDASGTTVVMSDVQSFSLTYFLSSTANKNYYTSTLYAPAADTLDAAERARLSAVLIRCVTVSNGYPREFTSMVRLRNSPHKRGV